MAKPDPLTSEAATRATADAVARRSYGKLVAFLAARSGDVAAAEDALSDAFVSALDHWPSQGCPANPEAWLLTAARRKLIDAARRRQRADTAYEAHTHLCQTFAVPTADGEIPDQRLALLFACAHPAIEAGIHAPLMLQTVLGLNAAAIAAAFLVSPATMSQRLVRAKTKIRAAAIPFRIPDREEIPERLGAVLSAIYAAYSEGWSDPAGTDAARRDLAAEALFLGRIVIELLPDEPEALGLLALMLHAEARRSTRRDPRGQYIPLAEQNPAAWDAPMIAEAESLLLRASRLGAIGRYQLEAALQSAHVHRRRTGLPNWDAVVQLYDTLLTLSASPVVALNRALAIAELQGPAAALAALPPLSSHPALAEYQPYWAARAELLSKAAHPVEARHAYEVALGLERDPAVRQFLQQRLAALSP